MSKSFLADGLLSDGTGSLYIYSGQRTIRVHQTILYSNNGQMGGALVGEAQIMYMYTRWAADGRERQRRVLAGQQRPGRDERWRRVLAGQQRPGRGEWWRRVLAGPRGEESSGGARGGSRICKILGLWGNSGDHTH